MACVWDERQKSWKAAITIPTGLHVYAAVFASSGSTVVLSTEMMEIAAFDIRSSAKPIWREGGYKGVAHCLRTSPYDTNVVGVASDCPAVTLLNAKTGQKIAQSFHHTDYVRSIAWDGQSSSRLFTGSWDKTVAEHTLTL